LDETGGLRVTNDIVEVGFDKTTGQLNLWRFRGQDLIAGVSQFNLGEGFPNDDMSLVKEYLTGSGELSLGNAEWSVNKQTNSIRATSTAVVKFGKEGQQVGTLTTAYTIQPNSQIAVQWKLDWKSSDKRAWEIGQKLMAPSRLGKQSWLRDSYFSLYPPGHIGAPEGACLSKDPAFRSSKRGLRWLTLTDASGTGLALLNLDSPLIGRADPMGGQTVLFASLEESGPRDFSDSWTWTHDIRLQKDKAYSGSYLLRPAVPGSR
jgi:hypothetical protein